MTIKSHRDLLVWQKSMVVVTGCYKLTERFPDRERYGLSSQLQRAAVSIPANIAEGNARRSTAAYINHLSIATGSLAELETHLLIAVNLGYITSSDCETVLNQIEEVRRMLAGLIRSLEQTQNERH